MLLLLILINFYFKKVILLKKLKCGLVITRRVKRLFFTFIVLISAITACVCFLAYKFNVLWFLLLGGIEFCLFIFVVVSNLINLPMEIIIKFYYIIKAKNKLKHFKQLKIIAITGSCGKTSTKNYLYELLKNKYNVLVSPASYNTQMGITITILNKLKSYHDILILEMGADHKNDIKKLCKIVKPDISVVTSVGYQHLKTFKTVKNIIKTKYQIVENTVKNGLFFTNLTNAICKRYFNSSCVKAYGVGINLKQAYCNVTNYKFSANGTEFEAIINGENVIFKTKLLGEFNIINLLLAVAVAVNLGVSITEIVKIVKTIEPTPHRLQLKKLNCGALLIDDGFNSNPVGAKNAVNVLKLFNKKRIVITCGMVDLGELQYKLNYNFGKQLAFLDEVLVVNTTNYNAIYDGVCSVNKRNVKLFNSFIEAYNYVLSFANENHVVLIENDLTDSYILN